MARRRKLKEGDKVGYQGARVTVLSHGTRSSVIRDQWGYVKTVKTSDLEDDPGPS